MIEELLVVAKTMKETLPFVKNIKKTNAIVEIYHNTPKK